MVREILKIMPDNSMVTAINKIHGVHYRRIMDLYKLLDPSAITEMMNFHLIQGGISFGLTHRYEEIFSGKCRVAIIGGPCICYCQANIKKITAQDVIDIVNPISLAAYLGCPVFIYFQVYEAIRQQQEIDQYQSSDADWEQLFSQLEKLTMHIASLFGMPPNRVNIISTSNPKVKSIIDHVLSIKEVEDYLTPEFLYGMYSINNESSHPKGSKAENLFVDIYRRNLATYLPISLGMLAGEEFLSVLVVENCTQLKTSYKANQLHQDLFPNTGSLVSHLVYISTPGLDGHEMYKSFPRHQVRLDIQESYLRKRLKKADDLITAYYGNIWPAQLCSRDLDEAERFIEGFNKIRESLNITK